MANEFLQAQKCIWLNENQSRAAPFDGKEGIKTLHRQSGKTGDEKRRLWQAARHDK